MVDRICPNCGIIYKANPGRLKWNRQTSCSRVCSYALRGQKNADISRGKPAWNKGLKTGIRPWNKWDAYPTKQCLVCGASIVINESERIKRTKFCSKACFYKGRDLKNTFTEGHQPYYWGKKHSEETKARMRIVNRAKAKRGAEAYNWKGGTGSERHQAMGKWEYKTWREEVFKRDKYTCQICGQCGGYLHADHIQPWSEYPELRYVVDNGRTLCVACHYQTTFKRKMPKDRKWAMTGMRG